MGLLHQESVTYPRLEHLLTPTLRAATNTISANRLQNKGSQPVTTYLSSSHFSGLFMYLTYFQTITRLPQSSDTPFYSVFAESLPSKNGWKLL